MKITETTHDNGRAFRTTRERFMNMQQALNIHDPFAFRAYERLESVPAWLLIFEQEHVNF